jgi:DNA-binding IclR family transcriptional regulator
VALALEAFARGKADCWPTNQTIADLVGCSVRTVQLCLASLERLGWLRRSHDPRAGGAMCSWLAGGTLPEPPRAV